MVKTVNRNVSSVDIPKIEYSFFNHTEWKGIYENKNFLAVDQETFDDTKNVYVNSQGLLKSRPAVVKNTLYSDNIVKIEQYENLTLTLVKNDTYSIKLYKNSSLLYEIENVTEFVKTCLINDKLFIFDNNMISYYDVISKEYVTDLSKILYVPITKQYDFTSVEEKEDANILTSSQRYTYIYALNKYNLELLGKNVYYELDGDRKEFINFSDVSTYDVYVKQDYLSTMFANDDIVITNSDVAGTSVLYNKTKQRAYYSLDNNVTYKEMFLPYDDILDCFISKDGLLFCVLTGYGLYVSYILSDGEITVDGSWIKLDTTFTYEDKIYNDEYIEGTKAVVVSIDEYIISLIEPVNEVVTLQQIKHFTYNNVSKNVTLSIPCMLSNRAINCKFKDNNTYLYSSSDCLNVDFMPTDIQTPVDENLILYTLTNNGALTNLTLSASLATDSYFIIAKHLSDVKFIKSDATPYSELNSEMITGAITASGVFDNHIYRANVLSVVEPEDNKVLLMEYVDYLDENYEVNHTNTFKFPTFNQEPCDIMPESNLSVKCSFTDVKLAAIITNNRRRTVHSYVHYSPLSNEYGYSFYNYGETTKDGVLISDLFVMTCNELYSLSSKEMLIGDFDFDKIYYISDTWIASKLLNGKHVYYTNNVQTPIIFTENVNYSDDKEPKLTNSNIDIVYFGTNLYLADKNILRISDIRYDKENVLLYFPENLHHSFPSDITNMHTISNKDLAVFFEDSIYYVSKDEESKVYTYNRSKVQVGCKKGSDITTSYDGKFTIFSSNRGLVALSYEQFVASTEQVLTFLSDAIYNRYKNFNTDSIKLFKYDYWIFVYKQSSKDVYLYDIRNSSWWYLEYPENVMDIANIDNNVKFVFNNRLYDTSFDENKYYDLLDTKKKIDWYFVSQKLHLNAVNYYKHIISFTIASVDDANNPVNVKLDVTNYRKNVDRGAEEVISYDVDVIRTFVKRVNYSKVAEFQYKISSNLQNAIQVPIGISNISIKYNVTGALR